MPDEIQPPAAPKPPASVDGQARRKPQGGGGQAAESRPAVPPQREIVGPARAPQRAPLRREAVGAPVQARSFDVIHDHSFGNCRGVLEVSPHGLSFVSPSETDSLRLDHGTYSISIAGARLTVKSRTRTYNFKPAAARNKSEGTAQVETIARTISAARPAL